MERGFAFHLAADGYALKGAGERVHKVFVLIHLRARSVTQSCMPRINLRFTAAWAPRRRESLYTQNVFPAVTNFDAGMVLAESTGLALRKAVALDPD